MVLGILGRHCGGFIYLLLPGDAAQLRILPCALRPSPTLEERISASPMFANIRTSAATETVCPVWRRPLFSTSGSKRYNTLDFPDGKSCANRVLLAPIGNPEPRGYSPLDTPFFIAGEYPNRKNSICCRCEENAKGIFRA